MSNYSALRVAQLREMCMQRGIDGASMRKRELIDALRLDDDIRNGIGVNDDVEDQAVCDCETREQPSGGVDVDETNRSIKITDGQRRRLQLFIRFISQLKKDRFGT